ncbi:MAG: Maf family nucleotide pyrophosphatase [Betaproteobacteria bacterium]|nr:Maf family nucleotide pyrophosphatase [Betaproteobacteria bacterium]MDH5220628.1 Maf family nucleotide pyrophosphatase [Betaproteobacteria bacterium]MDH5350546.1 Maf family nucleotide pyrophosphatase [Betaproteobacteria bacterium]
MAKLLDRSIYLASRSPRRRELLGHIGVKFHLLLFRNRPGAAPDVDEDPHAGEDPRDYVMRVARAKAAIGWQRMLERNLPRAPVLAADTTVALGGRIFGKPADRREAGEMLAALSGQRHEVLTAVALQYDDEVETALSVSEVQFRELGAEEIRDYVATGEPDDKAGAYAIQGRAALFVSEIRGSQSGIVGLPLYETAQLLQKMSGRRERRSPR